jgi:hypothetical protein
MLLEPRGEAKGYRLVRKIQGKQGVVKNNICWPRYCYREKKGLLIGLRGFKKIWDLTQILFSQKWEGIEKRTLTKDF